MSSTPVILIAPQDLAVTAPATPLFTADVGGKGAWVDHLVIFNHSVAIATVTALVGSGAASNSYTYSLAAGASSLCPEITGGFLDKGYTLNFSASTTASVSIIASGRSLA